jgi:hypothetical protein
MTNSIFNLANTCFTGKHLLAMAKNIEYVTPLMEQNRTKQLLRNIVQ